MTSVGIAALKNQLNHYLRLVRRGETVLVRDRDRVIARIEPAGDGTVARGGDDEQWLADLERRGKIRRATRKLDLAWLEERPRVDCDVVQAVLDEREEGFAVIPEPT
jgi:antitoxin (DNA-binding transcriptional repressor) of toxin-antitoxin stability system